MGVLLAKIGKQSHSHQRAKGLIPPRWGINAQILSASVLMEASLMRGFLQQMRTATHVLHLT